MKNIDECNEQFAEVIAECKRNNETIDQMYRRKFGKPFRLKDSKDRYGREYNWHMKYRFIVEFDSPMELEEVVLERMERKMEKILQDKIKIPCVVMQDIDIAA